MLHSLSPAAQGEFVACEASAFAEAMLRDDGRTVLDAVTGSPAGGTLFLEDVGEVPASLQKHLLNIFHIAGRNRLRVVTGTHRNLRTMGVTGQFRPDLAQRLMGVEIALPPLQTRPEDLRAVVGTLLRRTDLAAEPQLSEPAFALLAEHTWSGDLAELDTVLRTASTAAGSAQVIAIEHLPALRPAESFVQRTTRLDRLEDVVQHHVLDVLTRCAGNKLRAAEMLGISRSTLYRMLETCVGEAFNAE
jgi:transcriptional regulator of acetoin/glycerol metabolism